MSAFHLKTEIVSVGSVCQMCETTEFREGLPDTHFLVYKYNCTSCNSCNVGETKFSHNWIENLVTDFVSGRFKIKKISCANYVWIYLLTGRWWSVPGRWKSCLGRTYRRWHGKWGIFHQGVLNIIFIGYGNFCGHGFKTNFFKFQSMSTRSRLLRLLCPLSPSYPGYKRFFSRKRVGASVSFAGRNRKPRMKSLWYLGYVHPYYS